MIWGPFQAVMNNCEQQRKQLWFPPCQIHLSRDLWLSEVCLALSSICKNRCHKHFLVILPPARFYVGTSFILGSCLAPVLKGFKLASCNKNNNPKNNIINRANTMNENSAVS